ncbi:MAG: zf-HC2 domain-containing protein, partial [Acidobacteriota bacterium]|nr:zf-HC2 domain-containing protein [Acidobacteriota bacterium]
MNCCDVQPQIPAYADGALNGIDRQRIDAHLESCPACRREADVQGMMREVLAEHGRDAAPAAPPWLRTRIAAQLAADRIPEVAIGWRTRLSAFAAAAVVVLTVGAATMPIITGRSTVVLAAQLALDHLKCFTIDGHDHGDTLTVAAAEAKLLDTYGWSVAVPSNAGAVDGRLVAVRRCLYGDGLAAHLLYRIGGEPVSLFIVPGLERPSESMSILGHDEVVWAA